MSGPKLILTQSLGDEERWRSALALLQAYASFDAPLDWGATGAALATLAGDGAVARAFRSLALLDAPPLVVPKEEWPGGVLDVQALEWGDFIEWCSMGEIWVW